MTPSTPLYSRRTAAILVAVAGIVISLWWIGTPTGFAAKLAAVGYAICHQIVSRSFLIGVDPMPLCARCTGIYLGVVTGYVLMIVGRRGRAARLPSGWVAAILTLFVAIMAVDGANSFLHLFPGAPGVYEPHNSLRVITGIYAGFAVFNGMFPLFNHVVWRDPQDVPPLRDLRELAGACGIVGVVALLTLSERPLFLIILSYASIFGVILMLTMVGTALFLTFTRHEGAIRHRRELWLPLLAGFTIAFIELGGVAALRLALTGTWAGFPL